jgi:hypothetical protein
MVHEHLNMQSLEMELKGASRSKLLALLQSLIF